MHTVANLSVLSGGRAPGSGAARRSENAVLDRLFYMVPSAVPDFCPGCGGGVEAQLQPWGPTWQCSDADCRHRAPHLVSVDHLDLLLAASPDWRCGCCGDTFALRFDQPELLPSCESDTTTDWATLAARVGDARQAG